MKTKLIVIFLVYVLITPLFVNSGFFAEAQIIQLPTVDVLVGIDVAYENSNEIKKLIDEVSAYTNLLVIGCTGITYNQTLLNEICQQLHEKNMSFIIYRDWLRRNSTEWFPLWVENARAYYKDKFLGFYYSDEIGGKQLDRHEHLTVTDATDAHDAAKQFIEVVGNQLRRFNLTHNSSTPMPLFTSDYALYWFDYKAGYDAVFAEFGWNYSRQLNVALCRGAANVQGKEWGIMITWTYTNPPYIESGKELYEDMVLAYNNGAKYIVIFDTNEEYTSGILKEEHLQAIKQFWRYTQENPRNNTITDRVAFVLPKDYAYGFRGPNDKIWGLWEANQFSLELSVHVDYLLKQYGTKLDIIYEDGLQEGNSYGYSKIIYWSKIGLPQYPYPSPATSHNPTLSPPQTQVNALLTQAEGVAPLEGYSHLFATTVAVCTAALVLVFFRIKRRKLK
ncbi:MAG: hypothetical protein N3D85_06510 [Candidatus Bathyarchaeota archaeon]|nr:hypothetical protein [Candidatus Bathyarchaeota archaeon]